MALKNSAIFYETQLKGSGVLFGSTGDRIAKQPNGKSTRPTFDAVRQGYGLPLPGAQPLLGTKRPADVSVDERPVKRQKITTTGIFAPQTPNPADDKKELAAMIASLYGDKTLALRR